MIADDFHIRRAAFRPSKTDPVPLVQTNAVLTFAVTMERFQPVSRWNLQLPDRFDGIQLIEFPRRNGPQRAWTGLSCGLRISPVEDVLRPNVAK